MDGRDPSQDQWWHPGEAATAAADDNFLDMFANSTEDLFQLVWEGGTAGQPAASSIIPSSPPPAELPHVSLGPPPSNDVMAAWLYPIVSGETHQAAGDSMKQPAKVKSEPEPSMATVSLGTMTTDSKGKLPATVDIPGVKKTNTRSDSDERRNPASGGSSRTTRSPHYSGTHNITEKRRRCKISDRLRTLQQLVPGCNKSNQASTLEQTIQYMKSLQQQIESMNMRPAAPAAAVYPIVQPLPTAAVATEQVVRPVPVVPMVQYGAMLPYAHYHAMMMSAAGSAAPVMMPVPATSANLEEQCSISTEQQQHKNEKGKRRL